MINYDEIIKQFYTQGTELWNILYVHSSAVAQLALQIVDLHPELKADRQFVLEGAMLHDIGICRTNAPGIQCFGEAEYICHGYIGSEMLTSIGLTRHALVCERHTGAGITLDEIISNNMPIPHRDMTPQSIEEKIICYADKFFSKSKKLDEPKPFDNVIASLQKFGDATVERFLSMHEMFK